MNRREFVTKGSLAGIAFLAGCAGAQTDLKDPSKFDINSFVSWYRRNKLYNARNPNLRSPHRANHIFVDSFNRWTPGVDYSVPSGEVMVAVAPGRVREIGEISGTGRAGGKFIKVVHEVPDWIYSSYYNHVAEPLVRFYDLVERGQPLCHVPSYYSDIAKLYVQEEGNHVDPDNYGENHSYMQYQGGPLPIDEEDKTNPLLASQRLTKQKELVTNVDRLRKGRYQEDNLLESLWHNKNGYKPSQWSTIEKFSFLETLYDMHPQQFPNLSKEEFEAIRKQFYQNQPIVLTLPFKKGGLR